MGTVSPAGDWGVVLIQLEALLVFQNGLDAVAREAGTLGGLCAVAEHDGSILEGKGGPSP